MCGECSVSLTLTRTVHALAFWVDYSLTPGAEAGSGNYVSHNPFSGGRPDARRIWENYKRVRGAAGEAGERDAANEWGHEAARPLSGNVAVSNASVPRPNP